MLCTFFTQTISSIKRQQGIGLLEVLVALLVLSIGVLGAVMLQLSALRYTASAAYTTQASFLAYDMLDRMRANSTDLTRYALKVSSGCHDSPAAPDILTTDRQDFIRAVSCLLPDGYGNVAINDNYATVTIGWSEARIASGEHAEFVVGSKILGQP